MTVECPKCQTNNPDDSKFCKECATPFPGIDGISISQTSTLQTPSKPLTRGARFADRYEIIEKLGEGGMGAVYRVDDTKVHEEVALKIINPYVAADKQNIERFRNELKYARKIRHKHVCQMFDLGEDKGIHFITMEYVPGEDLKSLLRRTGKLTIEMAIRVAKQMAAGLTEAHRLGIIHRDLKPSNIMIDKEGHARILDFGIARSTKAKGITGAGLVIGTPEYMSPEQAEGREADSRSDIYSLGVILFEMLTGQRPFEGDSALGVAMKHKGEMPKDPKELNQLIPDDLSSVILKCLEKNKESRYQNSGEIRSELERIEQDLPTTKRIETKKKPITSREITVHFSLKKFYIPALVVITVIVAGLIIWSPWANKEQASPLSIKAPSISPFLATEVIDDHPAWSPSGNLIAYVSDKNGNKDVWICDISGSNPMNLTEDFQQTDTYPAWSPDGQHIAFYSMRDGGGIFRMSVLGGDVRKVVSVKPSVLYTFSLQWANDRSIVYIDFDADEYKQVFRVSEDGDSRECLTRELKGGEGVGMAGQISPSGKFLLFTSAETRMRSRLFLVDLHSKSVQLISPQVSHPIWSPNEDCFYYISNKEGQADLWMQALDERSDVTSSEPQRLTSAMNIEKFTISPDGKSILASKRRSHSTLWSFPLSLDRIQSLDVGTQLTSTQEFQDISPWYSKQMNLIFFNSNRRGSMDIWTLSPDKKDLSRLTSTPGYEHRPKPSHSGSWVAYGAPTERGSGIYLMRPDGSNVHLLKSSLSPEIIIWGCTDWSPDDTKLLSLYNLDYKAYGGLAITTLDVDSGEVVDIHLLDLPGQGEQMARWSHDGKYFVYEALNDGSFNLWITDSNAKNPYQLTSSSGNERSAAWSPNSRHLYYISNGRSLWRIPMSSNGRPSAPPESWFVPPSKYGIESDSIDFFDGQLITSIFEEDIDIWMIEFYKK